jgi:hypothetical protein
MLTGEYVYLQSPSTAHRLRRKAVETRENFAARGRSAGNENRRWHGTTRTCRLGDNGQTTFCSSTACSLCSIIKTSFDLNAFGKKTSWGRCVLRDTCQCCSILIVGMPRFGRGIYTSSTSSKYASCPLSGAHTINPDLTDCSQFLTSLQI